ncbi:MAG TPA: hypothetical protein VL025_19805, partial [Thermoanaerobaculia bacterium]|nr:hypothetical protein [Thermoanaerobaculia bacterium]
QEIVIDHPAREGSGLLAVVYPEILKAHGWDLAFWTCSDEAPVEASLGALGRRRDTGEWEVVHPAKVKPNRKRPTDDCEALARRGDQVWLFGSQFGPKPGPLSPRRHFVARFDEATVECRIDETKIDLEVARGSFQLHRLINDALQASGLELIERGPNEERQCIQKARKKGKSKGKTWAQRIRSDDWPINLEAATFLVSGNLLLGLRYPVTREGQPILVELANPDTLFQDGEQPEIRALRVIDVGSRDEPRGVRALESFKEEVHAITGNLDSDPEESVLVQDHPEGSKAESCHHRLIYPGDTANSSAKEDRRVRAEEVHLLKDRTKVEGLALDGEGCFWYVVDDEKIRLLRVEVAV